ncbi:unnamed protein product, partial [Meganyctiphanes norvegica]
GCTLGIQCYWCINYPYSGGGRFYDANCGEEEYTGHTSQCDDCEACYLTVYNEDHGSVVDRGWTKLNSSSECEYGPYYTVCYCDQQLCNSNLCEQCNSTRNY